MRQLGAAGKIKQELYENKFNGSRKRTRREAIGVPNLPSVNFNEGIEAPGRFQQSGASLERRKATRRRNTAFACGFLPAIEEVHSLASVTVKNIAFTVNKTAHVTTFFH